MNNIIKEEIELIHENINPLDWRFVDTPKPYINWLYGEGCTEGYVNTSIGVKNVQSGKEVLLLASGGSSGVHETAYVFRENELVVCVGDCVFSLNRFDLTKKWIKKCDFATCFQVVKYGENYLIHGELSISMINRKGDILWTFSGRDIFVRPGDEVTFKVIDSEIYLMDWQGYEYTLNGDGVQIR